MRTEIDRLDVTRLHVQLAEILRGQIGSGELSARDALPSESQLAARYELGRGTVRAAVRLLIDEGLVVSVMGRGSYVAPR